MTTLPLSILDLVIVPEGRTVGEAVAASVELARRAEAWGYRRIWYAEHHGMDDIASSATSVIVAHVAAHTQRIRLGAGGVMLPNHSPLVIAEQFGTLESLHPGRIDLGLGRAPGGEPETFRALRRDPAAVVRHRNAPVRVDPHVDGVAASRQGLVDAVGDDFFHQVVQSPLGRVADVHGRPDPHVIDPAEHADLVGLISVIRQSVFCHGLILCRLSAFVAVATHDAQTELQPGDVAAGVRRLHTCQQAVFEEAVEFME